MFGIGMPEMIVILAVALIVIGPAKLPEIARSIGRGYAEFSRSMRTVQRDFEDMAEEFSEERKMIENPLETVSKAVYGSPDDSSGGKPAEPPSSPDDPTPAADPDKDTA